MIDKRQISHALALSCVEYYFLAWIEQRYPVERLYAQSFVSVKKVFADFADNDSYEYYGGIPRIQDTAESYGITEHTYTNATAKTARDLIAAQGADELCLIRVNKAFFDNYKREPWRPDHYVCVDNKFNWVNEYPLSDGTFTAEEFDRVYDEAICFYRLKNKDNIIPTEQLFAQLRDLQFTGITFDLSIDKFESAVGVLRVSRKRMLKFFADRAALRSVLKNETELLDRLYFTVRMQRIKRNIDETALHGKIKELIAMDRLIKEMIE